MFAVIDEEEIANLMSSETRLSMWIHFINRHQLAAVAELGVARGAFAQGLLESCSGIATYFLIDPWRHLADWNKPANKDDDLFEVFYNETLARTSPWESKRIVLRGRTTEMIHSIPDDSLDFAYVDADHTLRGITIDLIRVWAKVRPGGFIGGDDFCPSIWQHVETFEPTLVYPFAVYFAEAMGAPIIALPHNQFLIQKVAGFTFEDRSGEYQDPTLRAALASPEKQSARSFLKRTSQRITRGANQ